MNQWKTSLWERYASKGKTTWEEGYRPYYALIEMVMEEVSNERERQAQLFGCQNGLTPEQWTAILTEEVGEVAKASMEGDAAAAWTELVQVMAVCCAMLESIDYHRVLEEKQHECCD